MSMDDIIKQKIIAALQPEHLEVINESYKHAGHAGDDGSGETHYILKVVSKRFDGLGRIERQKLVYQALEQELRSGIHALSLRLLSSVEN